MSESAKYIQFMDALDAAMTRLEEKSDTPETDEFASTRRTAQEWTDHAQKLERERNDALRLIDNIDEIMRTMKPLYRFDPDPCWIVWLPKEGTCKRKTLREAISEFMDQVEILSENAKEHAPGAHEGRLK